MQVTCQYGIQTFLEPDAQFPILLCDINHTWGFLDRFL